MQDITCTENVKQVPIVILNWNDWEDTISCIDSIYAAENEPLIWVVDNKSDLDKSEDLKKKYPNVIFIMNDKNYGWAVANNIAIDIAKHAGHSHIYLLNNDCLVEAGFLSRSLQQMEDDTATIGSYIVSLDGDSVIFDGEYADGEQAVSRQNILKNTAKVNGAGMLINIAAFYQTGEFDARYFCYQEGTESLKAKKVCFLMCFVCFSFFVGLLFLFFVTDKTLKGASTYRYISFLVPILAFMVAQGVLVLYKWQKKTAIFVCAFLIGNTFLS